MKLQNGGEYIESLRALNPVIYYKGERIDDVTRHPATAPHVRAAAMTYSLAAVAGIPALIGFNAGSVARRFASMPEDAVVASALGVVESLSRR